MARTLWSELPVECRESLTMHAPEWILKALQHLRCGHSCWVPKPGQMPRHEQKQAARLRYLALRDDGVPYRKRLLILSGELEVSTRTVRRWLLGDG